MSKELTAVDGLKKSIANMEPQFKAALPAHVPARKFARVLMTAVSNNPDLADASRPSLFSSCMKLAEMGLLPDNKEAALITFKTKHGLVAKEMPMAQGLLKLVRNSGELASYSTNIVCEHDEFEYWVDTDGEHLKHRPNMFSARGKALGVYGMAKTKDGAVYIEVMGVEDIEKVRNSSRASDYGPWKDWWNEMAKKTVFRRLYKRLPSSTDIDQAFESDDEFFVPPVIAAAPETEPEKEVKPKKTKSSKLKTAIDVTPKAEPLKNFAPGASDGPPLDETPMPI